MSENELAAVQARMAAGGGECPKKKEKPERSRTYAPANFRCHFEERSF